jgi:hypothetical protein
MATNKTQSNNTNKKGRDKNLIAFDNNQIDDATAKTEAVERVIGKIFSRYLLPHREGLFFKQMINDVKSYKVDGFTIDDFYLIAKFNSSQKIANEACGILSFYFWKLCGIAEQEAKQKDEQEIIECYENFKSAAGLLRLALPMNYRCRSIKELEEYKNYSSTQSDDKSYFNDANFKKMELTAYFFEFVTKAESYFKSDLAIIHYLRKDELRQQEKDRFREALRALADFSNTKAKDDIRNSTLTQSICDYVMKNFADFLTEYKKPEINFRTLTTQQ